MSSSCENIQLASLPAKSTCWCSYGRVCAPPIHRIVIERQATRQDKRKTQLAKVTMIYNTTLNMRRRGRHSDNSDSSSERYNDGDMVNTVKAGTQHIVHSIRSRENGNISSILFQMQEELISNCTHTHRQIKSSEKSFITSLDL